MVRRRLNLLPIRNVTFSVTGQYLYLNVALPQNRMLGQNSVNVATHFLFFILPCIVGGMSTNLPGLNILETGSMLFVSAFE